MHRNEKRFTGVVVLTRNKEELKTALEAAMAAVVRRARARDPGPSVTPALRIVRKDSDAA
jgi:hypothetical protein